LASLEDFALEHRPDFLEAKLSVDRAKAERALTGAAAWEDWSVMFGMQDSKTVLEQVPAQPHDGVLLLSLSVPVPLFNRNQGSRAAAHASELAAGDRLSALELRIRNEVAARHQEASRLAGAAQSLKEQALPLSAHNLEQARTAYQSGQFNISDVVQIERQAFDINMSYEETVARYFQAIAALEAASFARVDFATHFGTPVLSKPHHGQGH
jgi:cobalt-zinc-cadmium efflux system outer membrane protein